MRRDGNVLLVALLSITMAACTSTAPLPAAAPAQAKPTDQDLMDVSVQQLRQFYKARTFTVTDVVQWHLDRIDRYNSVYGAIETVLREQAKADALRLDGDLRSGATMGPLFGVPIVIKANTSIKGQVTTAGWDGFTRKGHELIAPDDALIVKKFKAAGAVIVGIANMPDLANSDTNRSTSFGRTGNAYDVRFSPGGSSGGIVTAIAANMAVLGNGTDTGNSIRMPAATSALVGVFPTRGLVSIAGIAPLDWLLDNTGPIARNAQDAAIALSVMQGEDPLDARTHDVPATAQKAPYDAKLNPGALKGKRFGVPAFVLAGDGIPFHGIPPGLSDAEFEKVRTAANTPLKPETREAFMKALDALRKAGAEIVMDDTVLPTAFAKMASRVATYAYMQDGTNQFLASFGPAGYHSAAEYLAATGSPLYVSSIGVEDGFRKFGSLQIAQRTLAGDAQAERMYLGPRRAILDEYVKTLDRLKLDGYVYPAIQMPPPDETMPQDGGISGGPHSATSWINMIGTPAIVVPAGFYPSGLPFGLEFSGRPWTDGDLLGIAYAWEQQTHPRKPPVLVDKGLLPITPARPGR